jgi:uncharacterized protein YegJ (DUF2314 family)
MDDDLDLDDDDLLAKPAWDFVEWPWRPYSPHIDWAVYQMDLTDQIMCAQASFLEFARAVEYQRHLILPIYESIGIKAWFESSGKPPMVGEHLFLTNIFTDGTTILGTLNADSYRRQDLKEGNEVSFPIEKLSDWFLVLNGKGLGGFTIPFVWSQLSPEAQRQVQAEPPFVWFSHRGEKTAMEELLALPKCIQCQKRNIAYPDSEQPCSICRRGSRRVECPGCGAPLIRNEKLPDFCSRCLK